MKYLLICIVALFLCTGISMAGDSGSSDEIYRDAMNEVYKTRGRWQCQDRCDRAYRDNADPHDKIMKKKWYDCRMKCN